ncbi:MAG: hypothetical protein WCE79_05895 [Xanthobacteraceae bacterium]
MAYEDYRKDLIAGYYAHQLETLMSGYQPNRPTVILLPGGMGSQLERSESKFPASPNVINDVVWLDPGILWPKYDALKLKMTPQQEDLDKHVIAAHGPVSLFGVTTPYGELKDFAWDSDWNYGVFGYDWRRSLAESAAYFKAFILAFQKRVKSDFGKDPIPDLTIVCHSMGGTVCTYALTDANFSGLGFHAILTIATPFYGTSTQQERYYVGDPILNKIYDPKVVVDITSSLPGPFTLMFLPKETYNADGKKLGLKRYPQLDPNGNTDADPYDPAMLGRWPKPVKAHKQYLVDAKGELKKLAAPINGKIAPVFFNVRSSLDPKTAIELLWNNINGDTFIPGKTPSPLTGIPGPGDGTVPAWSAWHAYSRPKNRYDLKEASDHGNLLEHDEVLAVIGAIVKTRKLPTAAKLAAAKRSIARKRGAARLSVASGKRAADITAEWAQRAKSKQPPPPELFDDAVKRAIVGDLIGGPKVRMASAKAAAATMAAEAPAAKKKKKRTKRKTRR